jgi:hypothetical protein
LQTAATFDAFLSAARHCSPESSLVVSLALIALSAAAFQQLAAHCLDDRSGGRRQAVGGLPAGVS